MLSPLGKGSVKGAVYLLLTCTLLFFISILCANLTPFNLSFLSTEFILAILGTRYPEHKPPYPEEYCSVMALTQSLVHSSFSSYQANILPAIEFIFKHNFNSIFLKSNIVAVSIVIKILSQRILMSSFETIKFTDLCTLYLDPLALDHLCGLSQSVFISLASSE